jgi:hypothetical protein
MAYRFKCTKCHKWHEGLPEVSYDRPRYAHDVPETERESRVRLGSDLCAVDNEHFFIRVRLPLKISEIGEEWGWGVWSSLSEKNFKRYVTHFDEDMSAWEPMFGYLSNQLPDYPDTLNLKLTIQPGPKGMRPEALLEQTDHPLAIEQSGGIALERVLKFCEPFLHS